MFPNQPLTHIFKIKTAFCGGEAGRQGHGVAQVHQRDGTRRQGALNNNMLKKIVRNTLTIPVQCDFFSVLDPFT